MMDPEHPLETETLESLKKELANAQRSCISSESARKIHLEEARRLTSKLSETLFDAEDADSWVKFYTAEIKNIKKRIERRMEKE